MKKQLGIIAFIFLLPLLMAKTALADLNEGLMGYWPLDGNANDLSGNGNHGLVSTPIPTDDRFGNPNSAYLFDGVNDRIVIPSSESLNPVDQLTISFWFQFDKTTANWSPIIFKGGVQRLEDAANLEYAVWLWLNESPFFHLASAGDNSFQHALGSNTTLSSEKWFFFTGVIDRRNHVMKVYINGELDRHKHDSYSSFNTNDDQLEFGGTGDSGTFRPFSGVLDEVRLYNRALSDSEVRQLFDGKDVPPPPLLYSQEELDAAYEAGKQACRTDPTSCGISNPDEIPDTGTKAQLSFSTLEPFYNVGDLLKIDLVETLEGVSRFDRVDLWVVIQLPNDGLLFMTPLALGQFSPSPQPFRESLDSSQITHRVLEFDVIPGLGGNYTFYAVYVEEGQNPMTDSFLVLRSNVATVDVVLSNR